MEVAFFGGNFLGLGPDYIKAVLYEARTFVRAGLVDGIRFSTRPDTIDSERLYLIKPYPVSTVELGVQSMDDHILALARRGHTAADTQKAVDLLKQYNYTIGLQMMVGLPGDNHEKTLASAGKISALQPDFVRIYPTVVLDGSLLASWYQTGKYKPLELDDGVDIVKKLYLYFKDKDIAVIRMGLHMSAEDQRLNPIIAGPYHPSFGHLVHSKIFLDLAVSALNSKRDVFDTVTIKVHPHSVSKMRGLNNDNIKTLKNRFQIGSLNISPDPTLAEDQLILA